MYRKLFRFVLALHPTEFRDRFASEMLTAYELALEDYSQRALLVDACLSLFRQRWIFLLTRNGAAHGAFTARANSMMTSTYVPHGSQLLPVKRLLQGGVSTGLLVITLAAADVNVPFHGFKPSDRNVVMIYLGTPQARITVGRP